MDFTYDFHSHRVDFIEFGQVISSYRSLFNSYFANSKAEFNKRQINEVAYTFAGIAALKYTHSFKS